MFASAVARPWQTVQSNCSALRASRKRIGNHRAAGLMLIDLRQ
jgi:hypothetical protein